MFISGCGGVTLSLPRTPNFFTSFNPNRSTQPGPSVLGVRMLAFLLLTLTGANGAPNGAPVLGRKRRLEAGDRDHSLAPPGSALTGGQSTFTGEQSTSSWESTAAAHGGQVVLSTTAAVVQPADGSAALGGGPTELLPDDSAEGSTGTSGQGTEVQPADDSGAEQRHPQRRRHGAAAAAEKERLRLLGVRRTAARQQLRQELRQEAGEAPKQEGAAAKAAEKAAAKAVEKAAKAAEKEAKTVR